ncbi:MAG: transposase [Stellaceae bacterium]
MLAPSERYAAERGRGHKKLTGWARQMVLQVRRWLPDRALVLVADSSFAALELLAALLGQGMIGVTRPRLDAALYEPAPPRRRGTLGRPPTKGRRLPNLANVLTAATTRWQRVRVSGWYGERDRLIGFCSATAVRGHAGLPVVPIRWVLLRDPLGRFDPQALLRTDPAREPLQILIWSSGAGRSRSSFARSATTSGSRPDGNGRTWLSPAPPHAYAHCFRW